MTDRLAWLHDELAQLERLALRRQRVVRHAPLQPEVQLAGRRWVQFASNDYLGLAADPRLAEAAAEALRAQGAGAGASGLITGHTEAHQALEAELAAFEGTEAALVFSSGYAANVGTISALVGRGDVVFSDQWNHASIIDGCRLSRADVVVYPHGDVAALQQHLRRAAGYRRRLIVSDTLFSMHGDVAPLEPLAELARRYEAMLMVDEAHATGVFGPAGRGLAEASHVEDEIDVRLGTLSKALGASGGFVAGSRALVDWLAQRARSYMFSTAPAPGSCGAARAALRIVAAEPQRRQRLLATAERVRAALVAQGWNVWPGHSQIIPIVVGAPQAALDLADALRQRGLWVPAIRPPSVPPGQSCLRISLSYAHTDAMIEQLLAALAELRPPG
jgi:8-amino-7-oxononanoate synthase